MITTPIGHNITEKRMVVKQGSSIVFNLTFTDENDDALNLTGFTFTGQVRGPALSSTLQASWTFDTTNAATGVIVATLAGSATASMTAGETERSKDSQYWYDLRYTRNSVDTYFLQGPFILTRRVTR